MRPWLHGIDHPAVRSIPIASAWREVVEALSRGDRAPFDALPEWQRRLIGPELGLSVAAEPAK